MNELEKLEKELLQEIQEEPQIYADTEEFCTIDPKTRIITVPPGKRIIGAESDQETNRLYFKCPKMVGDNVDLSLFSLRINYQNAGNKKDQYLVEDVKEEGDNITFSWLLKRNVTAYKGNVKFILCAVKTTEDGAIKNEWNTTLNTECESLEGMEVDQTGIEEETRDVVQQLIEMMKTSAQQAVTDVNNAGKTQTDKIQKAGETAVENIQAAAQEIIADREQIQTNKTEIAELRQKKAGAIIETATGEHIVASDSDKALLENLKLFGKSTQVKTKGYQLFDASKIPTKTAGGATVTNNGDGSFTVSGSGQLSDTYENHLILSNEETKKLLKAGTLKLKAERNVNPAFMAGLCPEDRNSFLPSKRLDVISNSFEITEDDLQTSRLRIVFYGNNGDSVTPGTIKPMLYQDGDGIWEPYSGGEPSPSPDYPQEIKSAGDSGEIEAGIYGRNLFNVAGIKSKTQNGVTVTIHDDQSFTITGSGSVSFSSSLLIPHEEFVRMFRAGGLKMNAINLNGAELPSPKPYFALYRSTESRPEQIGATLYHGTAYDIKQEHLEDETVYAEIGLYAWSGFTTVEGTFKAMLYQDGDGTWEPCKPVQSLTLKTPNGLPGIPVSSGGNYTDSTGQQWICDEIDLQRGVYVQRFKKVIIDQNTSLAADLGLYDTPEKITILFRHYDASIKKQGVILCRELLSSKDNWFVDAESANTTETGVDFRFTRERLGLGTETTPEENIIAVKKILETNPLHCLVELNVPIETPLSEDVIEAYKSLHTNYPTTVVTNDANVNMQLNYVADTKNFILNNIAQTNQAIVNTQAQLL